MNKLNKTIQFRITDNLRSIFDIASNNADIIKILTTQMNKLVDLVKLFSWINNLFQTSSSGSNPFGSNLLVSLVLLA